MSIWDHYDEDRAMARQFEERTRIVTQKSKRDPNVKHTTIFGGLQGTCSCPDFTYRRAPRGQECKHITYWNDVLRKAEAGDLAAQRELKKSKKYTPPTAF